MKRTLGYRFRTPWITSDQYSFSGRGPARCPHVRSKMGVMSSIAISQRMPSHCPAIDPTVSMIALRRPG